jgi:erythromycin esterase-like protein
MMQDDRLQVRAIGENAHAFTGARQDYDPLLELACESRFVLLGEASHGTHDFYHTRAQITERLIKEQGFSAVAVEADWPDAYRVNRYVRGRPGDDHAVEALDSFKRFPIWMWRNTDVVEFIAWLREYNDRLPEGTSTSIACTLPLERYSSSWTRSIPRQRDERVIVMRALKTLAKIRKPTDMPLALA